MRISCLICLLLIFSFSVRTQAADFELIRKKLEKVDSLLLTGNPQEAKRLLGNFQKGALSEASGLLVKIYLLEANLVNEDPAEANRFASLSNELIAADDSFLQAYFYLVKGAYFNKNSQNDSSLYYLKNAAESFRKNEFGCSKCTAKAFFKLASHYRSLYENDKAIPYYTLALNALQGEGDEFLYKPEIYFQLASIYQEKAEIEKAKTFILKAIALGKKAQLIRLINNSYVVYGNILYTAQKFAEAIDYYLLAIDGITKLEGVKSKRLINYYSNCGAIYSLIGEWDKSFQMLYRAKHLATAISGKESLDVSYTFFNLSNTHLKSGSVDSAGYYLNQNVKIKRKIYGNRHEEVGWAYFGLGQMFFELEMYDSALYYSQKALIANHPDFNESNIRENPAINSSINYSLFHMLFNKEKYLVGKWEQENDAEVLKLALSLYHKLDSLVFSQRSNLSTDISKLYLVDDMRGIFEIGLYLYSSTSVVETKRADQLENFYSILQKSKSVELLEEFAISEKAEKAVIPEEYRVEEQRLKAKLAQLELRDHQINVSDSILDLRLAMTQTLDSLKHEVSTRFPAFYQFKLADNLLSIAELAELLDLQETLFVEYYWGEEHVYALYYTGSKFKIRRIENKGLLEKHLKEVLTILKRRSNDADEYAQSAYFLVENLFGSELIESLLRVKSIHIVPDGLLSQLPFEALLTKEAGAKADFSQMDYLLEAASVTYDYSSTFLGRKMDFTEFSKTKLLALGSYEDGNARETYSLPGSKKELDGIRKVKNGQFVYGAAKSNLLDNLDDYHILHIALHGQADTVSFYGSFLQFIGGDFTNNRLYPFELYDKALTNDLVVLSACESGFGKSLKGEGILGMGRAFKFAGASAIIQSAWRADDDATERLMNRFYRSLDNDAYSYDKALHKAKLEFLKNGDEITAHPGRWAAMMYYGKPIERPTLHTVYFVFLIAGVLFIAAIWGIARKLA